MNNQNYYQSYLKYKKKYLELKKLYIGGKPIGTCLKFIADVHAEVAEGKKDDPNYTLSRYLGAHPQIEEEYRKCEDAIRRTSPPPPPPSRWKFPSENKEEAERRKKAIIKSKAIAKRDPAFIDSDDSDDGDD
jgi:hypothetical protein